MTKREQFWWFQGDSVLDLTSRLTADPHSARLEVRIDDDNRMTFRVVYAEQTLARDDDPPDINDSHLCPPDCPG